MKRHEKVGRIDDPKYYKYHRLISHLVEQFFVLKDKTMKLVWQGKIDLEEDVAISNFISGTSQIHVKEINHAYIIQFGSFDSIEVNFIQLMSFQVPRIPNSILEPIMIGLPKQEKKFINFFTFFLFIFFFLFCLPQIRK